MFDEDDDDQSREKTTMKKTKMKDEEGAKDLKRKESILKERENDQQAERTSTVSLADSPPFSTQQMMMKMKKKMKMTMMKMKSNSRRHLEKRVFESLSVSWRCCWMFGALEREKADEGTKERTGNESRRHDREKD